MSRRGNCWADACSETLRGALLEVEQLHRYRFATRRQARDQAFAWLLWYKPTQLHSRLAHISPMGFDQDWPSAQAKQAKLGTRHWDSDLRGKLTQMKKYRAALGGPMLPH